MERNGSADIHIRHQQLRVMGAAMKTDMMDQVEALPIKRVCPFNPPTELGEYRQQADLHRVRTPKGDLAWLVTRHADAKAVLMDKRFSSSPLAPGFPSYISGAVAPPPGFFMQHDAPDHSRMRSLVVREFLVEHVQMLRPLMQGIIDGTITSFVAQPQPADLIAHFAYPVASRIIGGLLGVPPEDSHFVQETTDQILDRASTAEKAEQAAIALMGYFAGVVAGKKVDPMDDLVSRLVQSALADGKASEEELVGTTALLFLGGYDTMAQIIGLGVAAFIKSPEQLQRFLDDENIGADMVDELVRYLSVNHAGLPRAAVEDVTVGGTKIRKGEGVLVMINAANRDACAFADADKFNLDRPSRHHLGFGHGLHKCIGAHFARVELDLVFRTLFSRLPRLELAEAFESLSFRDEMVLYGACAMPVRW
jgi:cytochrome P450